LKAVVARVLVSRDPTLSRALESVTLWLCAADQDFLFCYIHHQQLTVRCYGKG
jgi:hypothetical protein